MTSWEKVTRFHERARRRLRPAAPDRRAPWPDGSPSGPRLPAARPGGRGVAARRHAAVARRHRRRHRGGHQRRRLLQAGPRPRLRRRLPRSTAAASPSMPSPSPTSCAATTCSTPSAAPALLVTLQAGTPATTSAAALRPASSRSSSLLRRLIAVAGEISENAFTATGDVSMTIDRAESMVYEVAQRRVTDSMAKIGSLLERQPQPPRGALRARRVDHRRPHRLHRPRRDPRRPAAFEPGRHRRQAKYG